MRGGPLVRWWFPLLPVARVAWVRAAVALVALLEVLVLLPSPRRRAGMPELYDPVAVAAILRLPAPTTTIVWLLTVLTVLGAGAVLVGGFGRAPVWVQRVGGVALLLGYGPWCLYAMSFGYVAHDHMAIMVAIAVLPFAGTAFYTSVAEHRDRGAGWALRMVQVFTVATYFFSVLAKLVLSNWDPLRWVNSATLAWAFLRRPNPINEALLDYPALLRLGQWAGMALELSAPLVFVLRRWAKAALIGSFLMFHLVTMLLLGIHFLPTVICWSAFLPWERWVTAIDHRSRRRRLVAPPAPARTMD